MNEAPEQANKPKSNKDQDKRKYECCFKLCFKKKKKRKRSNSVSQIKYILSNNLDILQADNKKYSNNLTLFSPYRNNRNHNKARNNQNTSNINNGKNCCMQKMDTNWYLYTLMI